MITLSFGPGRAAGRSDSGARAHLRAATAAAHAAIEATPPMLALMGPRPTAADLAATLDAQRRILEPAEAALAAAEEPVRRLFADYRPRGPIAREDLEKLGAPAGAPAAGAARWVAALSSPEAWLGFRYVVEGSTLGGALIARRLAEAAPALPPLCFFEPHGADRSPRWRSFCTLLEAALPDRPSRDEAARGADATFGALRAALEGAAP